MPTLFWLDVIALCIATVLAASLTLMVLGAGTRRLLNRLFALYTLLSAALAVFDLLLRLTLWLEVGNPFLIVELRTLVLAVMGPVLLTFTGRYLGRHTRRNDIAAGTGLAVMALLTVPLFRHQVVTNPHLIANGTTVIELNTWGFLVAPLPLAYMIWSLVLFWQERHRTGEPYLALSVLILVLGSIVGGVLNVPFPVTSLTNALSVTILGYGVVRRQLFNPLRELTTELERKVAERARELSEATSRLESANATLQRRSAQLEGAAQVTRQVAAIRDLKLVLDTTVRLISEGFGFYSVAIYLLDQDGEYAARLAVLSQNGNSPLEGNYLIGVKEPGIIGRAITSGEPAVALEGGERAPGLDVPTTGSQMALPLKVRNRTIGVLDVHSTQEAAFSEEDIAVLQVMADQLAMTIENARLMDAMQQVVGELNSAAAEILTVTAQQAAGANEQSAAIAQTTTTVEEVRTVTDQSVARAQEVAYTSQRTVDISRRGQRAVRYAISSMQGIRTRVEGIAESILVLAERILKISQIIATVDDIAAQSKMLALNASVEAARAGEHGKGFAVVAAEVRNLAEQSRQATEQVRTILQEVQKAMSGTVMATEEGTKEVEEGAQLAAQAREAIEQLTTVIEESAQAATQMVAGGRQQSSGVEQIAVAMQAINQATAQSLASTRQAESTAQELSDLAHSLTEILKQH
jgi:methyl-accepting chemotaxis protein